MLTDIRDFGILPLQQACQIFAIDARQVALAFDVSGRCVSEARPLFLDVSKAHRLFLAEQQSMGGMDTLLAFWVSEIAHALAHLGTGSLRDAAFLQVHGDLMSRGMAYAMRAQRGRTSMW